AGSLPRPPAPRPAAAPRHLRGRAPTPAPVPSFACAACSGSAAPPLGRPVSIFPLYDTPRRVAGDRLQVPLVLPPGHDHHSFDPRPQDVAGLAQSALVFGVGLGLDDWVQDLASRAGSGAATVFEVGPLLDPILIRDGKTLDPH